MQMTIQNGNKKLNPWQDSKIAFWLINSDFFANDTWARYLYAAKTYINVYAPY